MDDMNIFAWVALCIAALTVTSTLVLIYIDTIADNQPDTSDAPGTGTEAISDERVRELLTRENYERDCI